jgi:hypothetical protein
MARLQFLLVRAYPPDTYPPVGSPTHQDISVRAESQGANRPSMACKGRPLLFAAAHVPQPYGSICTTAGEDQTIRAKDNRPKARRVRQRKLKPVSIPSFPEPDKAVCTTAGEDGTIRAKGNRPNIASVARQFLQIPTIVAV